MDELYQEPVPAPINDGVFLSNTAAFDLKRAAKWAKFLAIVGFVACGIIAIAALFVGSIFRSMPTDGPYRGVMSVMTTFVSIIYLLAAGVLFIIHLFLYQFANRTVIGIELSDTELIERGLHRLQSYFKTLGIIMIIELSLIALGMLIMMTGLAMRG